MKKLIFILFYLCSIPCLADLKVVADFPPIHSLVAMVLEGFNRPELVFSKRRDLSHHGIEFKASELRVLRKADVVFWLGSEFEPALGKAIAKMVPDAESVQLLSTTELNILKAPNSEKGRDVHIWMDPENAKIILRKVAGVLGQRDSKNASKYQANALKWSKEIDKLKNQIKTNASTATVVALHDGYPYLFEYLGMKNAKSLNVHAEYVTGPTTWRAIQKEIKGINPKCFISDPSVKKSQSIQLKNASKAKFIELDVMGSRFDPSSKQYIQMMEHTISQIYKCLD